MVKYVFYGIAWGAVHSLPACLDNNIFNMLFHGEIAGVLGDVFALISAGFLMTALLANKQTRRGYFLPFASVALVTMGAIVWWVQGLPVSFIFTCGTLILWFVGGFFARMLFPYSVSNRTTVSS